MMLKLRYLQILLALLRFQLQVVEVVGRLDPLLDQLLFGKFVVVRCCNIANVAAARMQHDPDTPALIIHDLSRQHISLRG